MVPTLASASGAPTHLPSGLPKSPGTRGWASRGSQEWLFWRIRVGGPAHCGAGERTHLLPSHFWYALGPQSQPGRLPGLGRGHD